MSEQFTPPWLVVVAAATPGTAAGILVLWKEYLARTEKRREHNLTREERLTAEMDARAALLSRENAELFERAKAELTRKDERNSELEAEYIRLARDRDRGWALARIWNALAHRMRHAALNAQQVAQGELIKVGKEAPAWPDVSLPDFEEPK